MMSGRGFTRSNYRSKWEPEHPRYQKDNAHYHIPAKRQVTVRGKEDILMYSICEKEDILKYSIYERIFSEKEK